MTPLVRSLLGCVVAGFAVGVAAAVAGVAVYRQAGR